MKQFKLNPFFGLSIATALALGACGPQAYVPGTIQSSQSAAGTMNLPPKIDIVLGVSQDGTMKDIYYSLQPEIQKFVQKLAASGWDYHFVSLPLSEYRSTTQNDFPLDQRVAVSRYDTNYDLSQWLPPFPGANFNDKTLGIHSNWFTTSFVTEGDDPYHNDARETGFRNEINFLNRSDVQAKFLRPDAVLAIINVSTGNDKSYGSWQTCPGWQSINPNVICFSDDPNGPVNFRNSIAPLKSNSLLLKHYALVANNVGSTIHCRSGVSWSGTNYIAASNLLGTPAIDICSTGIESAFEQVAQNLNIQKLSFVKPFLVLGTEPSVATVVVTKFSNGSSQTISQCPNNTAGSNCWTYEGHQNNIYTITSPVQMGLASGYILKLHGSAVLNGNDTATVSYMNVDGQMVAQ